MLVEAHWARPTNLGLLSSRAQIHKAQGRLLYWNKLSLLVGSDSPRTRLISLYFDWFLIPIWSFFFPNLLTYLSKKRANVLSLAYFVLTTGISHFSGAFPKSVGILPILAKREALGTEFQEEWGVWRGLGTKGSKNGSCNKHTVDCRVRTTVPWSQKLRTVEGTTGHLNHAWTLGRTVARAYTHDRAWPNFSQLNCFAIVVNVIWSQTFREHDWEVTLGFLFWVLFTPF